MTALVLLHAFPLSAAMWTAQAAALAPVARVLAPDQRGFGGAPLGDDPPSLDRAADDVVALLDRLALDDVVLGGLSMGGYVAMALLRRHPGRVRALVLADTKATADPPAARENRERIAARLEAEGTADVLVEDVLPGLTGATTGRERPEVAQRVRRMVEEAPPAAAAWAQRAMAARPDSLDTLRQVDVPALVLRGDEDGLSSAEDVDTMVRALQKGRLETIAGSGHLSAVEAPGAFNRALAGFLSSLG